MTQDSGVSRAEAERLAERLLAMDGISATCDCVDCVTVREAADALRRSAGEVTDADTSVICRGCDTLVAGVEAGSRARFVVCAKCRSAGPATASPEGERSPMLWWTAAEIEAEASARMESPARFYANPTTEINFVAAMASYIARRAVPDTAAPTLSVQCPRCAEFFEVEVKP